MTVFALIVEEAGRGRGTRNGRSQIDVGVGRGREAGAGAGLDSIRHFLAFEKAVLKSSESLGFCKVKHVHRQ